jgi:hypothetical protein
LIQLEFLDSDEPSPRTFDATDGLPKKIYRLYKIFDLYRQITSDARKTIFHCFLHKE